jgi:molybdate transport system substrate-binding protein
MLFGRVHPAWLAFGGSVALLAGLGFLLWSGSQPPGPSGALTLHAAAGLRAPLEDLAREYQQEFGQEVRLNFGPSHSVLTQLEIGKEQIDLFLPADDIYIDMAREKDLVNEVLPLARMTVVVVVRPDFDKPLRTWDDLVGGDVRVVLSAKATAIGQLAEDHLHKTGRWDALEKRLVTRPGTVNETASTVQIKSADAGIVWDAVAHQVPELRVVRLPELEGVTARVQVAVVKRSPHAPDALRLARYLAAPDRGLRRFREYGFTPVEGNEAFGAARPRIVVYAGSMLRPAVEQTIKEFAEREGVDIVTEYNGCGILVGMMRTREKPDVYFACDPQFMNKVSDLFETPQVISSNQLVIAVPKGNPHGLQTLKDLGKPGLKVGVGHEQQCALGAITRETFLQSGTYAAVRKNVVVESPAGDLLVNQLKTGSLDAVVAYRSNVEPFKDTLDAVPVTGIPCAAPQQPIAISRTTAHPQLVRRLVEAIRSAESRERFLHLGFGWELDQPFRPGSETESRP